MDLIVNNDKRPHPLAKIGSYTYLILMDKNDDPVVIDWLNGGVVHKATQFDRITCFTGPNHQMGKEIDQAIRNNMQQIINLNLGLGLRIAQMRVSYEVLPDVERSENPINQIG